MVLSWAYGEHDGLHPLIAEMNLEDWNVMRALLLERLHSPTQDQRQWDSLTEDKNTDTRFVSEQEQRRASGEFASELSTYSNICSWIILIVMLVGIFATFLWCFFGPAWLLIFFGIVFAIGLVVCCIVLWQLYLEDKWAGLMNWWANAGIWKPALISLECSTMLVAAIAAHPFAARPAPAINPDTTDVTVSPRVEHGHHQASAVKPSASHRRTEVAVAQSDDRTSGGQSDGEWPNDAVIRKVRVLLDQWAAATCSDDPEAAAAFYAATGVHYFLQANVDRAFIAEDRRQSYAQGLRPISLRLLNIILRKERDGSVIVSFLTVGELSSSTAGTGDGSPRQVVTRTVLKFEAFDGEWKIVSQRDYKG